MIQLIRFSLGRALIHLGLSVMPEGRARSELYQLLELWGTKIRADVIAAKPPS